MGSERGGEVFGVLLGTERCEEFELLRTNVGASEKEVCDLGGKSPTECTGGGTVIGEGVALALSDCGVCRPF
jgi:hypothetical protein